MHTEAHPLGASGGRPSAGCNAEEPRGQAVEKQSRRWQSNAAGSQFARLLRVGNNIDVEPTSSHASPARTSPRAGVKLGPRSQVEPRERIVEAMIRLVGEQGYAGITVADVILRSKASRRTFYQYFADRQSCLLAAGAEIATEWFERVSFAVDRAAEEQADRLEAFVAELMSVALADPDAVRLLLSDIPGVGDLGIERRQLLLGDLGRLLCEVLDLDMQGGLVNDGWPGGQVLLGQALAGAILRIPYARMLRGPRVGKPRRGELLALIPDIVRWAGLYRSMSDVSMSAAGEDYLPAGGRAPGTLSLPSRGNTKRGLPRSQAAISRSFVVHSQRERLLDAVANLSAAKGYGTVTIPDIVTEAAVSVQAFYEHFSGREDALLVAYELGHRKALGLVERAYEGQQQWPLAIHAAIETYLAFLASETSFARMSMLEVPAAGGKPAALASKGLEAYIDLLAPGLDANPDRLLLPAISAEASMGAVQELCCAYVFARRTRELPALADQITRMALTPFLMAERSE